MDIITFVEATIYQMDEENEQLVRNGVVDEHLCLEGKPTVACFDKT